MNEEAFQYRDHKLHCEEVNVEELVAAHGTPLYVYSRSSILSRFQQFDGAFSDVDRLIAYSVKANGNLSILRLLAEQGAGADIVSGGELHRALLAGIPPERIVFSGVGKTVVELAAGLNAGIYAFNVESEGELRELANLGYTMNKPAPIALRVNPDVKTDTPHHYTSTGHKQSKFGIPIEEARVIYRYARDHAGLHVRGVDVHIGSQILDVAPYQLALERVLELIDDLRADGIDLEYIDLGGGFGVSYEKGSETPPSEFAQALLPDLKRSGLRLVLEPGRFILGPSGVLLTRVLYIKRYGGKTFVITDAGMNDLLRPSHYASYHLIENAEEHVGREQRAVDVVGPICETGDFLALDRTMAMPQEGELLAIHTTGAYGFSMASTYNARTRPAEVLVAGADFRLIRKRETFDDLVRGEAELLS
ncbi:MAG TPA: diaminopimelate decarboxylase [Longimicrobiales bacterium]|nr:diaminopimelate decarboxylase [Longimicrobiales bacterium]